MMKFRPVYRVMRIHTINNSIKYTLEYRCNNSSAPRGAYYHEWLASFKYYRRRHATQHPFVRRYSIGLTTYRPIQIRHTRLYAKIVHLIIEQKASASNYASAPEFAIQCCGH